MKKLTTEEFIIKARRVHGNKYDYSKSEYIKSNIDISIICPDHGEFNQRPNNHLSGKGCYKCGREVTNNFCRSNNEEFIIKARRVHGNKYNYSEVEYYNWETKVNIICPDHGEFEQTPNSHLNGSGCPYCTKLISKSELEHRLKRIKGYSFEVINFNGIKSEIKFIHRKCGGIGFGIYQKIINQKYPCESCRKVGNISSTTNEFIRKSKEIHGNTYDYSLVEYIKSNIDVSIICKKHGLFNQTPNKHLLGQGCSLCGYENLNVDWAEFIRRCHKKYGKFWKFDINEWVGLSSNVKIKCPKHGVSERRASNILKGKRPCYKCGFDDNFLYWKRRGFDNEEDS